MTEAQRQIAKKVFRDIRIVLEEKGVFLCGYEKQVIPVIAAALKRARNDAWITAVIMIDEHGLDEEKDSVILRTIHACQDRIRALKEE